MKSDKCVLFISICIFSLSAGIGFITALYVEKSVGNNLFALSFHNRSSAFSDHDIEFLTQENYDFTFTARLGLGAANETTVAQVEVIGTNASYASIYRLNIISGSFFNHIQEEKLSNVAVLNSEAAWHFFGNNRCVGNSISINKKKYQVIGVVDSISSYREDKQIYIPYDNMVKNQTESTIYEILIAVDNISYIDRLIRNSGYVPSEIRIFDLEQYKNMMTQRVRIIVFLCGTGVIVCLVRMCLLSIKVISGEAKLLGESHYAADIWLFIKRKSFLFELLLLAGKILLIFLVLNTIKFKLCLPYYFFSMRSLNYFTLVDLLRFFIQPDVSFPALEYLNGLNLLSNAMFVVSIVSGTVILSVRITKRHSLNFVKRNQTYKPV